MHRKRNSMYPHKVCFKYTIAHLLKHPSAKLPNMHISWVGACAPPMKCLNKENTITQIIVQPSVCDKSPHSISNIIVIKVFKKHSKPYMYTSCWSWSISSPDILINLFTTWTRSLRGNFVLWPYQQRKSFSTYS